MQPPPATIEYSHIPAPEPTPIDWAVARLDAWLDTVRGPRGYGGPVAHWWQQSLLYTGAGLDWRYEGIVDGYVTLWETSGDEHWLLKAQQAADDLLAGQSEQGHFAASGFEENPSSAGTPHEAAADVALLRLALALRAAGRPEAERYAAGALRNLHGFYLSRLWDTAARSFRDSPGVPSFVPNKAATVCDALFLLADLTGDESWVARYALPTLDRIVKHQVRGGALDGAIAQNSFGTQVVATYFPIYIARCVPALLHGYSRANDERYADAALAAMKFIVRWMRADGSLPTAIYPNLKTSRGPSWVAPLGDVLRAADALRLYGHGHDMSAAERRLLAGQDASGGIQTATGFAIQAGGRAPTLPDLRDVLHVAGWCDKAFRYLAAHASPALPAATSERFEAECVFVGQVLKLTETNSALTVAGRDGECYRWNKGEPWARAPNPAFWLR